MINVKVLVDAPNQKILLFHSQIGVAVVNEAASIFVTIIAGVKVDQASLADCLTALGA